MRRSLALAGLLLLPVAAAQPAEAHRRHGRKAKVVRTIPNASDELLACIYHHESRGRYDAVSRSGRYRGAAQFDARTWRGAVARAGLGEWSGTPVNEVPAGVQDAAVRQLLAERGLAPWSVAVRRGCG